MTATDETNQYCSQPMQVHNTLQQNQSIAIDAAANAEKNKSIAIDASAGLGPYENINVAIGVLSGHLQQCMFDEELHMHVRFNIEFVACDNHHSYVV